jgi:membrane protease YdiL (CAAX protease family)
MRLLWSLLKPQQMRRPQFKLFLAVGGKRRLIGRAMRHIRSLLIYFAVVFLGGALLVPWLYWATQWGAGQWPALSGLAAKPFHRFLARALLGLALIGLFPLLGPAGMLQWRAIGLGKQGRPAADVLRGFCAGFVSLACVAVLALAAHGRTVGPWQSATQIVRSLVGAALVAVIVAVLEELLFRGALFGVLRKAMPWPGALVASSAVYSAAHFIQNVDQAGAIRWYSGLTLLVEMFGHGPALIPAFFTLFAAGACLALAYQRKGSLYFSIGLHAGWIFWLRSYKLVTQPAPGANPAIWGTDKLFDGWLALIVLGVVLCVILRLVRVTPDKLQGVYS